MAAIHFSISYKRRHNLFDTVKSCFVRCQNWFVSIVFFFYDVVYNILILYTHNRFCRAHTYTDIIWWIAFGWNHGRIIKKRTNGRTPWLGIMAGQGIPTAATCCSIAHIYICLLRTTALHTTVWPVNVYKISERTDLVVFVLILFPQMSNILLLKSVPLAQPQISNRIMCPY